MFFKSKQQKQEVQKAYGGRGEGSHESEIASAKAAAEAAATTVITEILESRVAPNDQSVGKKLDESNGGKWANKNSNKKEPNPPSVESSGLIGTQNSGILVDDKNRPSRSQNANERPSTTGEGDCPDSHTNQPTTDATTLPRTLEKLYKSARFTGYLTLALASFINYDAAVGSSHSSTTMNVSVPSLESQRRYAMAASMVSLILSAFLLIVHLDRITPLRKIWIAMFKTGSKFELAIATFLVAWWTLAVGFETSVGGIAGDGKGQYSLYYSTWACCFTSYSILERWWVEAGWSSFKSFISSWPHRSPAWILISVISFFTLIWYVDLRQNWTSLDRPEEKFNRQHFENVSLGQWQVLMSVISFTFIPSTFFALIELFRDTNTDGSIQAKSKVETIVEGICFLTITLMWIPTVMIATTSGGAASLIGNAYFFTWLLVVIVFEGVVWFIHDLRKEQHQALKKKEAEYRKRQRKVLDQALTLQNQTHFLDVND